MERQTSGDALGGFNFDEMVLGEQGTPMELGTAGLRGLDASDFSMAAATQGVHSTFENTTFRSAPAVSGVDAAPIRLARDAGLAKPGLVPLSLRPAGLGAPLQSVVLSTKGPAPAAAMHRGREADAAVAAEVVVAPVPGFPYELEPVTVVRQDFRCHADAATALMAGLRTAGVDFTADPKRALWRCSVASSAAYVGFTVQMHMAAGRYVFEVQRRSGEGMAFMATYRQIKASLHGKAPGKAPARPAMFSPTLPDSLLALVSVPVKADPVEEVGQPLTLMASPFLDVQREGVRSVSDLTADAGARDRLAAAPRAVNLLLDGLVRFLGTSPEVEAKTFATAALANVTEHAAFSTALMAVPARAAVLHTLAGHVQNGSYEDAQMRREAARALANVARSHGAHVTEVLGAAAVRKFQSSLAALVDPRMRDYALQLSAGLQPVAA